MKVRRGVDVGRVFQGKDGGGHALGADRSVFNLLSRNIVPIAR